MRSSADAAGIWPSLGWQGRPPALLVRPTAKSRRQRAELNAEINMAVARVAWRHEEVAGGRIGTAKPRLVHARPSSQATERCAHVAAVEVS